MWGLRQQHTWLWAALPSLDDSVVRLWALFSDAQLFAHSEDTQQFNEQLDLTSY